MTLISLGEGRCISQDMFHVNKCNNNEIFAIEESESSVEHIF